MTSANDFFLYNELFLNLGAVNSPSEVQGMLCGKLACGQQVEKSAWLKEAIEFMDLAHLNLDEEQASALEAMFEFTTQLLNAEDYSFSPLIPDDEASLARRIEELGFWCQGFLHGVGTSGLKGESKFSPESAEAIRDLAEMSQVVMDDDGEEDDQEENEKNFVLLVEHVKATVLNLYMEFSTPKPEQSEESIDKNVH